MPGKIVTAHVLELVEFVFEKLMSPFVKLNLLGVFLLDVLKGLGGLLLRGELLDDLVHILHTSCLVDFVEVLLVLCELLLTTLVVQVRRVFDAVLILVEVSVPVVGLLLFLLLLYLGSVGLFLLLHLFDKVFLLLDRLLLLVDVVQPQLPHSSLFILVLPEFCDGELFSMGGVMVEKTKLLVVVLLALE